MERYRIVLELEVANLNPKQVLKRLLQAPGMRVHHLQTELIRGPKLTLTEVQLCVQEKYDLDASASWATAKMLCDDRWFSSTEDFLQYLDKLEKLGTDTDHCVICDKADKQYHEDEDGNKVCTKCFEQVGREKGETE